MSITITVAKGVSEEDFQQIEALARQLQGTDYNFSGRAIWVERGLSTAVTDPQDALRAALLRLMVDELLSKRSATPSRVLPDVRSAGVSARPDHGHSGL